MGVMRILPPNYFLPFLLLLSCWVPVEDSGRAEPGLARPISQRLQACNVVSLLQTDFGKILGWEAPLGVQRDVGGVGIGSRGKPMLREHMRRV